jgi:hypothetical protein
MLDQWQEELASRFGLRFEILDRDYVPETADDGWLLPVNIRRLEAWGTTIDARCERMYPSRGGSV